MPLMGGHHIIENGHFQNRADVQEGARQREVHNSARRAMAALLCMLYGHNLLARHPLQLGATSRHFPARNF